MLLADNEQMRLLRIFQLVLYASRQCPAVETCQRMTCLIRGQILGIHGRPMCT